MEDISTIVFEDDRLKLDVHVDVDKETVWIGIDDMVNLFERDRTVIQKHIRNILKEKELDMSTCVKFAQVQIEGNREIERTKDLYNLDMAISVGFRVKSRRGILFRQWATRVLKEYTLKGVVYNDKRLKQLERMQEIQVALKIIYFRGRIVWI